MDNIYFLLLIAVVGLIQWIMRIVEEQKNAEAEKRAGNPPPQAAVPPPRGRQTTSTATTPEEERVRKFMEALGVPLDAPPAAPPPPRRPEVAPRQAAPPPPAQQQQPPRRPKVRPIDPFPVPRTTSRPPPAPVQPPPAPRYEKPPQLPTVETTMFQPSRMAPSFPSTSEPDAYELEAMSPYERAEAAARGAQPANTLAERLASGEGLREAIVLREIFGPPRSLQPLEPHRSR
jgi:hypothetical protein